MYFGVLALNAKESWPMGGDLERTFERRACIDEDDEVIKTLFSTRVQHVQVCNFIFHVCN